MRSSNPEQQSIPTSILHIMLLTIKTTRLIPGNIQVPVVEVVGKEELVQLFSKDCLLGRLELAVVVEEAVGSMAEWVHCAKLVGVDSLDDIGKVA